MLIVEGADGTYANAFIACGLIFSANHIVSTPTEMMALSSPATSEVGFFFFSQLEGRDLARGHWPAEIHGFEAAQAEVGESVSVIGYHGPGRNTFKIETNVVEVDSGGAIVVQCQEGQPAFQKGMSGSAGVTSKGQVVGGLSRKAGPGRAVLEPVAA